MADATGVAKLPKAVMVFTLAMLLSQAMGGSSASAPDIVLQSGHGANISALAFTPNGKFLVTASEDSTLKLWNPETGAEIRTLRGHSNIVTALAISADSALIASASLDHTLRVWNTATGETLAVIRGPQPTVYLLRITPDSNSLVTAETVAAGTILRLWDIKTGKQVRLIKRDDAAVSYIFFGTAGTMLVGEESGEDDATGALATYDLRTGKLFETRREILCGVSDNGKWVAIDRSTQKARQAVIVDLAHAQPFAKLSGQVSRVMFSSNGDWLAYELPSGDTAIVRKTAGGAAQTIHGRSAEFSMLALSPDGRWLASAGSDYSVHIWDVESGKLAHGMPGQYTPSAVAFSPDGRHVAVNGGATDLASGVQIWDIERRALVNGPRVKHSSSGIAFSKDGAYLAVSAAGVEVFDAQTNEPMAKLDCAAGSAASPAFSPNGRWAGANCGGVITVWSLAASTEVFHFGVASDTNTGPIAFSPDGRYLAATTANGVAVYDIAARKVWANITTVEPVIALVFNATADTLACGIRLRAAPKSDEKPATLLLLDMRTRRKLWSTAAGQWVSALKFTRDGRGLLAATGEDLHKSGTLTVYDVASGRQLHTVRARVPSSANATFSPNGEWFAFGSNSATSLWHL